MLQFVIFSKPKVLDKWNYDKAGKMTKQRSFILLNLKESIFLYKTTPCYSLNPPPFQICHFRVGFVIEMIVVLSQFDLFDISIFSEKKNPFFQFSFFF